MSPAFLSEAKLAKLRVMLEPLLRRRITALLVIICIVLLFLLTHYLRNAFWGEQHNATLVLKTIEGTYDIDRLTVLIDYHANGQDELFVEASGGSASQTSQKGVYLIEVHPDVHLQEIHGEGIEYQKSRTGHFIEFNDQRKAQFSAHYTGEIFSRSAGNVRLRFRIMKLDGAELQAKVLVRGLSDVAVGDSFPTPSTRLPHMIEFTTKAKEDYMGGNVTFVGGVDRNANLRAQYLIFAYGMIGGILCSILTTVLLEAAQFYDRKF